MFVEVHTPQHLTGQELDAYLARGWFRMGQTIFTTNFAHVQGQMLSTIWLRVQLFEYERDATHAKLLRRNARFTTNIRPATLTEEKETLYTRYRETLPFAISESLQHLLFGKAEVASIFTMYEVTLYDQGKLIGCGFFDLGCESAQGIVSFYDPAYKKYSPGKYLIYTKVQYCKELGMKFFYPGYFVPGNPYFDYKLRIAPAALEFFALGSTEWKRIKTFSADYIPVHVMETRLMQLRERMEASGVKSYVLKYEFFDASLIPEMQDSGLLDFPVFLHCEDRTEEPLNMIVVFDVCDNQYHVMVCAPVWKPDRTNPDTTFYSSFFLKPLQQVYQSGEACAIAELLVRINQHKAVHK